MKGKILGRLEVIDMADEGRAVCRFEGMVVFVTKAVPGDIVDVLVKKKHKTFFEGEVVKLHYPSPMRIAPFCKHFGTCGGCKWQYLEYAAQLDYKQKQVLDAMVRLGKFEEPPMLPIQGSPDTVYYRNKLDFSFADRKWLTKDEFEQKELLDGPALGFHIPGMFDKVLDIQECFLQPAPSDAIRLEVKKYALENNLTFINLRNRGGMLRSLIIRNTLKGDLMVIVMIYEDPENQLPGLLNHLAEKFPEITSLMYVLNPKANDTMYDLEIQTWKGNAFITEEMEGLQFRIGPKSFFQTNSKQSLKLYQLTREFAGLDGSQLVYDLYTGTGTIANFVSKQARAVVGIEYVQEAIEDAKLNSTLNGISNTTFFAGDMKDLLTESFFAEHGKPDVIITDPPRAGMHPDVVKQLIKSGAPKIVYVSCNPATQARDLQLMAETYRIVQLQPVDMFPHTAHVENIALLELIS
ncbi:23S rRNA (uracil(1939)-C(5))-methyltransferase RlmD [soil metagenome]